MIWDIIFHHVKQLGKDAPKGPYINSIRVIIAHQDYFRSSVPSGNYVLRQLLAHLNRQFLFRDGEFSFESVRNFLLFLRLFEANGRNPIRARDNLLFSKLLCEILLPGLVSLLDFQFLLLFNIFLQIPFITIIFGNLTINSWKSLFRLLCQNSAGSIKNGFRIFLICFLFFIHFISLI